MLLPKCPLCLAAWLALAGIGISAAAVAWVRGLIVVFWVAAVTLTAAQMIRERGARSGGLRPILRPSGLDAQNAEPSIEARR